jgi:hypothetical protein
MHNPQTRNQFIALRAQGWSLAHIAVQIHVHQRTLVVWNREMKEEIHHHRALEVEALQEKLLASHELELSRLASTLEAVEQELKKRDFAYASTTTLVHLAAKLRDQIRKIRIEPNFDLYPDPAPDSPEPTDPGSPFFTLHSALPDNTTKTPPELHHISAAPPVPLVHLVHSVLASARALGSGSSPSGGLSLVPRLSALALLSALFPPCFCPKIKCFPQ